MGAEIRDSAIFVRFVLCPSKVVVQMADLIIFQICESCSSEGGKTLYAWLGIEEREDCMICFFRIMSLV